NARGTDRGSSGENQVCSTNADSSPRGSSVSGRKSDESVRINAALARVSLFVQSLSDGSHRRVSIAKFSRSVAEMFLAAVARHARDSGGARPRGADQRGGDGGVRGIRGTLRFTESSAFFHFARVRDGAVDSCCPTGSRIRSENDRRGGRTKRPLLSDYRGVAPSFHSSH